MAEHSFTLSTRVKISYAVVLAVLLVFTGRLYQLQLVYQEDFGQKSRENSVRTVIREPVRGMIFDRRGRLIVDNRPSYTITVTPNEVRPDVIPDLAKLIGIEEQILVERIRRARAWSTFLPSKIQRDVPYEIIVALEEFNDYFPGVSYVVESKRHYNSGARMSHLLGYTKEISERQLARYPDRYRPGDVVGSAGIEAAYEEYLRGKRGFEYAIVNAVGQFVADYSGGSKNVPAKEGSDLFLTIDLDLQLLAEQLMEDMVGSIVVLDPRNGEILAFVSKPDYDLSVLAGVTPHDIWSTLNSDTLNPLFNRGTTSIYPPGSAYKMVLAAAALEEGIIDERWKTNCPGWHRFGNRIYNCHRPEGHGNINIVEAIQKSCNVFFYRLILDVGFDLWADYGRLFGFGRRTGIEVVEEKGGILPDRRYYDLIYGQGGWTKGNLLSLAIGQGEVSVTPLQMAVYSMLLANKGNYYKPHVVSHIFDTGNREVIEVPGKSMKVELSDITWDLIREGMYKVVEEEGGTGRRAKVQKVLSAGKTGTSQNPHGEGHAWYVGFAPYDEPKIAIAVIIENVGFGGVHAAPVAGRLIERYLSDYLVLRQ